jgi:protein-ribulosamine 3-kinase
VIPQALAATLAPYTGSISGAASVGGGCIAHATRLQAERGTFFLKHSDTEAGDTFEAEAAGLLALGEAARDTGIGVPRVLAAANRGPGPGHLLLEWIEPGRQDGRYWEGFGTALAALHRSPAPRTDPRGPYGLGSSNFIGRLPQTNRWHSDWPSYFADERLLPQLERARASGHWEPAWSKQGERLLSRLASLLPSAPFPSTLHGDLWSGNVLAGEDGRPWLVDPAAYIGDRETDLAMTELFGGFDARFHRAYQSAWPLQAGYEERRELYNLYHLLNHLNHFGASYAAGVGRILRRFGG